MAGNNQTMRNFKQALLFIKTFRNWPRCLWLEYSPNSRQNPFEYKLRNNYSLWGRPGTLDRGILMEIWGENCYGLPGWEINPGDNIIDIGGHIGVFSLYAASQAAGGKVIALEPDPDNYALLTRNIRHNKLGNVFAEPYAVAAETGDRELFLGNATETGGHSLVLGAGRSSIKIKTTTLQSVMEKYQLPRIDFLKLDCEGSEYEILSNLPPELWQKIHKIGMECHDVDKDRNVDTLQTLLADKGYKEIKRLPISPGLSYLFAK
jgi:FkbM family methyltransferase